MKKKLFYLLSAMSIVVVAIVFVDFFSLLGTKQQEKLGFVEARFKTVDAENGMPVLNVHVRCFQKKNDNACTQRDSYKAGVVSIKIPVRRIVSRSLFFNQGEMFMETKDPKLHILFIHPDYDNPVELFRTIDLFNNPGQQYLVKMPPEKES